MPHPSEDDRRKKRDALLRSQDEAIADHLAQAMKSGELQSAESYGKPMADQDDYLRTPVEFRLPFKILKNAGVTPPEIDLFHKRAALRQQLEAATTDDERDTLQRRLGDLELAIALRLEGMRVNGRL